MSEKIIGITAEIKTDITPEQVEAGETLGNERVRKTFSVFMLKTLSDRLDEYCTKSGVNIYHVIAEGIQLSLDAREKKMIPLFTDDIKYLERWIEDMAKKEEKLSGVKIGL